MEINEQKQANKDLRDKFAELTLRNDVLSKRKTVEEKMKTIGCPSGHLLKQRTYDK